MSAVLPNLCLHLAGRAELLMNWVQAAAVTRMECRMDLSQRRLWATWMVMEIWRLLFPVLIAVYTPGTTTVDVWPVGLLIGLGVCSEGGCPLRLWPI